MRIPFFSRPKEAEQQQAIHFKTTYPPEYEKMTEQERFNHLHNKRMEELMKNIKQPKN